MLALLCLRALGTNAQVAAPDLIGIADKNESGSFRRAAVDALGYVGPVKQVVPNLLQWATKPDPFVQIPAINGLGRLRPPAVEAVPHLMEWTTNSDQDVVVSAINALGGIGPPAKGAVPLLMGWATSARLRVAVNAKAALLQIDPEAAAKAGITNAP
jgi:HEAT repeat protein